MSRIVNIAIFATVTVIVIAAAIMIINDQTEEYNSEDNDLYVFLLSGQSNAQYYKYDLSVANELPKIPYGSALYYGTSETPAVYSDDYTSKISEYGIHSVTDESGSYVIGSIESGFSYGFYERTGKKCLIINAARGGASINDFLPGEYVNTYTNTILADALSKIPAEYNIKKTSVIWIQGEADRLMPASEYESKFIELVDYFDSVGFDNVLMSKVRAQWSPIISNAQKDIAKTIKSVKITDLPDSFSLAAGTMDPDGLHYSQEGRDDLGKNLAFMAPVASKEISSGFEVITVIPIILILTVILSIAVMIFRSRQF